ncbi:putative galacturonosyltransferase 4 -like protein [Gossypium arboreum]|uniref:Hexosyltransferase n=1 Tax=Gossypium arboreum TaxID=29729 RepID=A0A0B0M659_GOSAR|nr:putative galacturonosyltransferase 4 -like protein [Gossypium arboreum]KHG30551.1 putative galacturonosyltransferase 4 -like protein [Gossypium arboreum]
MLISSSSRRCLAIPDISMFFTRSNAFNVQFFAAGNFHRLERTHWSLTREHKSTRVLSATDEERQQQQLYNPIRQVIDRAPPGLTTTLDSHPNASDISEHSDNKHDRLTEPADAQVRHLKDQLIRAKVYLSLPAIKNNPHVTRELRLRVKEVTRALGDATKDSDLPKNAVDKLKAMDQSLEKGKQIQDDCAAVVKKLRAMLHSSEEQLRVHKKQTMFLTQLTAKTLPKGLHCLPLRLTTEYYTLNSSQQNFPNQQKLEDPRLYHYALFSDNILAAAVVVNSTISHAKHPSDHVFHIVTDRLNYAAMRMWFLTNPPGKATIQVQNIEEFTWLNSSYSPVLKQLGSPSMIDYYFRAHRASSDSNLKFRNPKYLSILNHLRFYLPEIFPKLNKVLFLDDDIVVQKDLTGLWSLDLKGNVNGAVETCGESFHRFDRYLNFSNPLISKNFDPHACGWAYGMNIFDLAEWRRQNITEVYHRWQRLNRDRQLWKLGTLPPGLITFWKRTYSLDKSWHVLGLGYNPNVNQREIDRAAVIHYNGNLKPWLEIGIPKYKIYWAKYVDYETVYLRECNINP